jgi:hypothetical protein
MGSRRERSGEEGEEEVVAAEADQSTEASDPVFPSVATAGTLRFPGISSRGNLQDFFLQFVRCN